MIKPKYKVGDRINSWEVIRVHYSWIDGEWVYQLKLVGSHRKLACLQSTLDSM